MSESNVILEVTDLKNTYSSRGVGLYGKKNEVNVLKGVSFSIQQGEVFGVVGESGCGKSTLGNAIFSLIDYEGEIQIDGEKISGRPTREQRKKTQAVFQDPLGALNPKKTIGWILEEPLKIHKVRSREERSRRVTEILELIGLDSTYKSRYPSELSGGQRQRICIGSALMLSPKLIVADEPVSALDVSAGSQILNLLYDLHNRLGLALLFISHNLNIVYYLCDRIAVMYYGRIVELGSAEEIYTNPRHPYTKALLAAVPDIDDIRLHKKVPEQPPLLESAEIPQKGCSFYNRCPVAEARCAESEPVLLPCSGCPKGHLAACHLIGNHSNKKEVPSSVNL